MQGFLRGWYQGCTKKAMVDKNRAWLHCVELLLQIEPQAKLLVCLRDLGQIYGSIEAQHQRTIFLDFIDHLADFDRFGRADQLFAKDKTIGAPMISLHAVPDLPKVVQEHLYFVRFEDLVDQPIACMSHIYAWLGLSAFKIDPENLVTLGPQESDSHYRMKYLHTQAARVTKPRRTRSRPASRRRSRLRARGTTNCITRKRPRRRVSGKRGVLPAPYSGTVRTGASGWDARAERSMAMAAYVMMAVTTQRISVR